jgi:hypothetical protein
MRAVLAYLSARAREPGTWRALALAGVAWGGLTDAQGAALVALASALVAAAGLPER